MNNLKFGEIKIYRPTEENQNFKNTDEYLVENSLVYNGEEKSDLANLQIANQGGLIVIRFANKNLGNFTSNELEQIKHDGTLLEKIGLTNEQIKFKLTFDISIELKSEKKYKATVTLEMPTGNIITEGTTNHQINGNEIVFKRY